MTDNQMMTETRQSVSLLTGSHFCPLTENNDTSLSLNLAGRNLTTEEEERLSENHPICFDLSFLYLFQACGLLF